MGIVISETGAKGSDDANDVRYDLVSPIGLRRVAQTMAYGAKTYGDFNWEKGISVAHNLNKAMRHIQMYLSGDRSEDHLGHLATRAMFACHSEEMWPHLNGNLRREGCLPPAENTDAAPDVHG